MLKQLLVILQHKYPQFRVTHYGNRKPVSWLLEITEHEIRTSCSEIYYIAPSDPKYLQKLNTIIHDVIPIRIHHK